MGMSKLIVGVLSEMGEVVVRVGAGGYGESPTATPKPRGSALANWALGRLG